MNNVRTPVVAGQFYAGTEDQLRNQIEECFTAEHGPGEVPKVREGSRRMVGLVSPHAGYPYSGPVAAHGFFHLAKDGKPEKIIILGPNHSGIGAGVAIDSSDSWETPFGEITIDNQLREGITSEIDVAEIDSAAHSREHSIEVQLPFLQYVFGNEFQIVPICVKRQDINTSEDLGTGIGKVAQKQNVLIIASTDMTHYESKESAGAKDREIIEKMKNLDWKGVTETTTSKNYSVCGYGPISTTLLASKKLDGGSGKEFKYATSGDTAGPSREVVGYCSLGIFKK